MTAQLLPENFYTSTEAARLLGVSSTTLRRWEDEGRVTPSRTFGGDRRYSPEDVQRVLTSFRQETDQRNHSNQPHPPARDAGAVPPPPAPAPGNGGHGPMFPIRQIENYRPEARKHPFRQLLVALVLVALGIQFFLALPPLTLDRLERALLPGPANPIIDVNDVAEYQIKESGEVRLGFKLPVDIGVLFARSLNVAENAILNTARFFGTIFFGPSDEYYITPIGDASLNDIDASSIDVGNITVSGKTIQEIADDGGDADTLGGNSGSYYLAWGNFTDTPTILSSLDGVTNDEGNIDLVAGTNITITPDDGANTITIAAGTDADTLDGLDSLQFLRSDTSDNYTSGTLTFEIGTTLAIEGVLTLPTTDITGAGSGSGLDADLLDGKDESAFGTLADDETIAGDWVNTDNPWADNEVADDLIISGGTIDDTPIGASTASTGSFTTLSSSEQYTNTVADGTTPFLITSTTLVANLNADLLGGESGAYYLDWLNFTGKPNIVSSVDGVTNNEGDVDLIEGANITITPDDTANTITFDVAGGSGSGLDADTLDTLDSLSFLRSDDTDNYTFGTLTLDAGTVLEIEGDLNISDAEITFDALDTTFTVTGDLSISPGGRLEVNSDALVTGHSAFGGNGSVSSSRVVNINETFTDPAGSYGLYSNLGVDLTADNSSSHYGITGYSSTTGAGTGYTLSGTNGLTGVAGYATNGTTDTVTNAQGFYAGGSNIGGGTIENAYGLRVGGFLNTSGTITNQYGIHISDMTTGVNNVGLYIVDAGTYSLQLASEDGDAASGITFGTDTNLYRSDTGTLTTDDNLIVDLNLTVNGDAILGSSSADTITFNGLIGSDFIPSIDDNYDLGSPTARWQSLYLGPDSLNIYNTIGADAEYFTIGYDGTPTITFSSLADGIGTARNFNFAGGNVGIGTATPSAALDIEKTTPELRLTNSGTSEYTRVNRTAASNLVSWLNRVSQPGIDPYALEFDGNDEVQVPDNASIRLTGGDFTVRAWVYLNSAAASSSRMIVEKIGVSYARDWNVGIDASRQLTFKHWGDSGGNYASIGTVPLTTWTHVQVSVDQTNDLVYFAVGGTVESQAFTSSFQPEDQYNGVLRIGKDSGEFPAQEDFDGRIDELELSDTVRNTADFTPSTNNLSPDANTQALWHLDEGTGTNADDDSGNGNDGTLSADPNDPAWVTGYVTDAGTTVEATVWSSENGGGAGEGGIQKFGDPGGGTWLRGLTQRFYIGAGEEMRLDASGNLGIGTTSPSERLEVSGNAKLTSIGDQLIFADDGYIESSADNTIELQSAGTTDFKISDRIPLKIQYTDTFFFSNANLEKTGTASVSTQYPSYDLILQGSGWNTTTEGAVDLTGTIRLAAGSGATGAVPYRIGIFDDTPTEWVAFDLQNQFVGIRTIDPQSPLDVNGNINVQAGNNYTIDDWAIIGSDGAGENNYLFSAQTSLSVRNWEDDTNLVTIENDGDIGIGDETPSYKLDVNGDIRAISELYLSNSDVTLSVENTYNYLKFGANNTSIYLDYFAANVGINDDTPDYLLELYDATNTPAFALSDDDIGHGVTTLAQTDVFFHLSSIETTAGGAQITGLADATGIALGLKGIQSSDPTDTTPAISLIGAKANGTGVQDLLAAETVLQIANNDDTAALTILGDGKLGIGTAVPLAPLNLSYGDSSTATQLQLARIDRTTTGTAAVGIGGYTSTYLEDAAGALFEAGRVGFRASNVTSGAASAAAFMVNVERETYTDMIPVLAAYATGADRLLCMNGTEGAVSDWDCFGMTIGSANAVTYNFDGTSRFKFDYDATNTTSTIFAINIADDLRLATLGAGQPISLDQGNVDGPELSLDSSGDAIFNTVVQVKPSVFDPVYNFDGGATYTNNTSEAQTSGGTPFTVLALENPSNDEFYIGFTNYTFRKVSIDIATAGVGVTLSAQYWTSGGGGVWTALTIADGTSNLTTDGTITFTAPGNWNQTSVNGVTRYWIRLRSTGTNITTAPTAYFVSLSTANRFYAYAQAGDTNPAFYINQYGNVGIGTATPKQELDVAGSIYSTKVNTTRYSYFGDEFSKRSLSAGTDDPGNSYYEDTDSTSIGLQMGDTEAWGFDENTTGYTALGDDSINGTAFVTVDDNVSTGSHGAMIYVADAATLNNAELQWRVANKPIYIGKFAKAGTNVSADHCFFAGLSSQTTANSGADCTTGASNSLIGFQNTTTTLQAVVGNASAETPLTCTGATIVVNQSFWVRFEVFSSSSVKFWYDMNVDDGSVDESYCGEITTGIPSAAMSTAVATASSDAINSGTFFVDYVRIWQDDQPVDRTLDYEFFFTTDGQMKLDLATTVPADHAEFYNSSEAVENGDLLVIDPANEGGVKKSTKTYQSSIIGVASNDPAIVMDEDNITFSENLEDNFNPIKPYVALVGRVPVKISAENGPIVPGDPLTSSSIPGVAMKATQKGPTVGKALESFSGSGVGKISMFVNVSWYDSSVLVDSGGVVAQSNPDGTTTAIASPTVEAKEGIFEKITATILGTFEKIIAKTAEIASAFIKKLTVESLAVKGDSIGQIVIPAGEKEISVEYPDLTETSKVFFTLDRAVAVGVEKTVGTGFKFILASPADLAITVDYWIVE